MVSHIVMFKFRDNVSAAERETARTTFKAGIEALPEVIPFIRYVHVGFNINPKEKWDICLTSAFDSLTDATAYGAHPAHKAVAMELMKYIAERACVDFQADGANL